MIHLILQGGLGNQMFEYATALAISKEYGHCIELDLSFFDCYGGRDWCRDYGLDIFSIGSNIKFSHRYATLVRILPKISLFCRKRGVHRLGPIVFELNDVKDIPKRKNLILFGYFANSHIFEHYSSDIRQAFRFSSEPDYTNLSLIQRITVSESVAVHIRRGDYLSAANNGFARNGEEWYRRAISYMASFIQNPVWYFFSDDILWAENTFSDLSGAIFVDINHGNDSYNDMRLMSICKHNIIANSTFSWWGAWLNANPDKVVVAPRSYYSNLKSNRIKYLDRMIPVGWIVLE